MLELLYLQNHILKLINCVLIIASVEKEYNAENKETLVWVHYDKITVTFRDDSAFECSGNIQKLPPRQQICPL